MRSITIEGRLVLPDIEPAIALQAARPPTRRPGRFGDERAGTGSAAIASIWIAFYIVAAINYLVSTDPKQDAASMASSPTLIDVQQSR